MGDNVKVDFREMVWWDVGRIYPTQERDERQRTPSALVQGGEFLNDLGNWQLLNKDAHLTSSCELTNL